MQIWPSNASIFGQTFLQGFSHHFRLLTGCCQRFTHPPIVFLSCEANAYFIGSGFVGSLFFFSFRASRGYAPPAHVHCSHKIWRKRETARSVRAPFSCILKSYTWRHLLSDWFKVLNANDLQTSSALRLVQKYWIGMSSIVPFVLWNLNKRILLCDWLHAISTPLTTTVAKVQ